jgi:hypothetical protein
MTLSTSVGAKSAPLPIILSNRDSRLVKAAIAVTEAKEHNLDDKSMWRPLHGLWEREIKRACPSYRPLKGEYFGTLCDSGREGAPACSHCGQCQFFSSLADSKAVDTVEARSRLRAAAASAGLLVNITPPAPVATVVAVDATEAAALALPAEAIQEWLPPLAANIPAPVPAAVKEAAPIDDDDIDIGVWPWHHATVVEVEAAQGAAALPPPAEAIEEWLSLRALKVRVPVPAAVKPPDVPVSPRYKYRRQSKHARRIAELKKRTVKTVPVRKGIDEPPASVPAMNMAAIKQKALEFADLLRQ